MRSLRLPSNLALAVLLLLASVSAFAQNNDAKYDAGMKAAAANDPFGARDAFCSIDPTFKDAATNCKIYTDAAKKQDQRWFDNFTAGADLLSKGQYDEAAVKFQNVKGGKWKSEAERQLGLIPGLKAKAQQQAQAAANASAAAQADTDAQNKFTNASNAFNSGDYATAKNLAGQLAGTKFASQAQDLMNKIREAEQAKSAAASKPNVPAPKPQVDTGRLMAEANQAFKKKDYKTARRLVGQVLLADRNNGEAQKLQSDIADIGGGETSAEEDDPQLAGAISDFYRGDYSSAEAAMKFYYRQKGVLKPGLARFYLGACSLTRFYLGGGEDSSLMEDAKRYFKEAKAQAGFNPPEKYVSPKIMKVYKDATGS